MLRRRTVLLTLAIPLAAIGGYVLAPSKEDEQSGGIPRVAGTEQAAEFAASEAIHNYPRGTPGFARAAALSTMNLVETNISAPRYAELRSQGIHPVTAAENWKAQAGLCQGSSDAYEAVMKELGIRTRRLNLFWISPDGVENSHATVETWWGGRWHWLDPTYGVVYTRPGDVEDILSFTQVRAGEPGRLRLNESDEWWMQALVQGGPDPIGFVAWPDRKLLWLPVRGESVVPEQADELPPLTEREWEAPPTRRIG